MSETHSVRMVCYGPAVIQLTLRLPDDLHAEISAMAKAEKRSLNNQLLWLLEHSVAATRERSNA